MDFHSITRDLTLGSLKRLSSVDRFCGHTVYVPALMARRVTIVDGGGNIGAFAGAISRRFHATVYSFEPNSAFHQQLSAHNTKLIPKALAAHVGETTFYRSSNNEAGNLLGPVDFVSAVTVPTTTLEQFLTAEAIQHVDLLKLDIEGSEIEVLRSLPHRILRGIDQITVEYHEEIYPDHAAAISEIDRRLIGFGFRRYRFSYPGLHDILYLNSSVDVPRCRLRLAAGVAQLARKILAFLPVAA
jgi:FkbM family methyltransferase